MNIAGIHAVKHALQSGAGIQEIVIEKGKHHPRLDELIHLAKKAHVRVSFASRHTLNHMAGDTPHQGVVATTMEAPRTNFDTWLQDLDMEERPIVLLLDSITDPHNLGACIRSAEASGCAGVVIPRDRSADLSPTVAKAASGAMHRMAVLRVVNLVRAMDQLQKHGFWLVGLAGETPTPLHQVDLSGSVGIVMGSEGKGLRPLVRKQCDLVAKVPMQGAVESLNVSVATGIALYEAQRQRSFGEG
ncbi:MAG: 23S rRNA (guanosine(2251)-2'-O)-methyltransferase RlmB [Mariprofundaceae bacterium]